MTRGLKKTRPELSDIVCTFANTPPLCIFDANSARRIGSARRRNEVANASAATAKGRIFRQVASAVGGDGGTANLAAAERRPRLRGISHRPQRTLLRRRQVGQSRPASSGSSLRRLPTPGCARIPAPNLAFSVTLLYFAIFDMYRSELGRRLQRLAGNMLKANKEEIACERACCLLCQRQQDL